MYKILIVEDDRGIAEAIKEQAKMWDLQAQCVQNFRNVLADFADYDPHLVLLDIALPFFNEMCIRDSSSSTSSITPTLALSAPALSGPSGFAATS